MKNKVFLIGIAAILLLSLTAVTSVAAQESPGWHRKDYAPDKIFIHEWTGTLLGTRSGIQYWELYSEMMPMMPTTSGMGGGDIEWVKMTIMWDPVAEKGRIIKFEHHGMYLHYTLTGLTGTIEYVGNTVTNTDGGYHFQVSGLGKGCYGLDSRYSNLFGSFEGVWWHNLIIFVNFTGVFHPRISSDGNANQGPFEMGWSEATERATLIYWALPIPRGPSMTPTP